MPSLALGMVHESMQVMSLRTFFAAASTAVVLALTGCAAEDVDDGELVVSQADELAKSGPTYAVGTTLRTTENLNLRASGSTKARVLRVMPKGAKVTVRAKSGGNGWVAVKFSGYSGWAHTSYLARVSSTPAKSSSSPSGYSAARGSKLAKTALRVNGLRSRGYCALEMSNSVERSGILPRGVRWYRNHAINISEYMASNTSYTKRVGFKRVNVSPSKIPQGSVIGWRRGQCGYHKKYGHIEIAASSTRACSDYCGAIKKTCGNPYVFMPTKL